MARLIAFVLAESSVARPSSPHTSEKGRGLVDAKPIQSAPQYYGDAAPKQFLIRKEGDITIKSYPPDVLIAEVSREVTDAFSDEAFTLRDAMIEEGRAALEKNHRSE